MPTPRETISLRICTDADIVSCGTFKNFAHVDSSSPPSP
jgi:hypothetical protein